MRDKQIRKSRSDLIARDNVACRPALPNATPSRQYIIIRTRGSFLQVFDIFPRSCCKSSEPRHDEATARSPRADEWLRTCIDKMRSHAGDRTSNQARRSQCFETVRLCRDQCSVNSSFPNLFSSMNQYQDPRWAHKQYSKNAGSNYW